LRVLLTGATGLVGSAVLAALSSKGHELVAIAHGQPPPAGLGAVQWARVDLARQDVESWLPLLDGVDAVVNCAGVLQDSPRDSTAAVHVKGPAALFEACLRKGVRRIIHFSAIGVDRGALTAFSASKLAGDEKLMAMDLDWVILRPSVIVGGPVYGASALFRGLAALPILPAMPETGPLQVVQLDDVTRTVLYFLRDDVPTRLALEIAGPQKLSFTEIVLLYRRWLGWRAPYVVQLPSWAAAVAYRAGDLVAWLGWRPPIRSTARREISRGAVGDPSRWMHLTNIIPRTLEASLLAEPASVQQRWFARLYLLKPLVIGIFALFWLATGIISVGPGYATGVAYLNAGGITKWAGLSVIAGGLADMVIGIGVAIRRTARIALYAALLVTVFYLVAGTLVLPSLWADPLGPMLKVWPILALNLVALAILEDR